MTRTWTPSRTVTFTVVVELSSYRLRSLALPVHAGDSESESARDSDRLDYHHHSSSPRTRSPIGAPGPACEYKPENCFLDRIYYYIAAWHSLALQCNASGSQDPICSSSSDSVSDLSTTPSRTCRRRTSTLALAPVRLNSPPFTRFDPPGRLRRDWCQKIPPKGVVRSSASIRFSGSMKRGVPAGTTGSGHIGTLSYSCCRAKRPRGSHRTF